VNNSLSLAVGFGPSNLCFMKTVHL